MINRREFLQKSVVGAAMGVSTLAAHPAFAGSQGSRRISFRNAHTGESFSGVYRVGDKYLPVAFRRINHVLRDFRTGDVFPIDPRVIDIIHAVREKADEDRPYEVYSGYRSPETNAMLRRASSGVAKKSLHMSGQAIDLHLPGLSVRRLRDLAVDLRAGGVGFYPSSGFVHMDTGDFRTW